MATYYKNNREGADPVIRTEKSERDPQSNYIISCEAGQLEVAERYICAVAQIDVLRRLCDREVEDAKNSDYPRCPAIDVAVIRAVIGNE